ncbi:class I SAM-dependent methyltransferase [Dongia sp.]|uniref:class I SAM-dependent methyltransferase n=1 Tax=Dongia sp. TaxID=1977262 RepID=UPI0035B1334E
MMSQLANHTLKEEIRQYWSDRATTFDLAFGHRLPPGPEFDAWRAAITNHLDNAPRDVLELACGTGEVTRVLLSLGYRVTGLDFSEAMLATAKRKHLEKGEQVRFLLADAENTYLPAAGFDAIVCRHLVWTLTDPAAAFREWHRLLRPGGKLLMFDGDWAHPTARGRMAAKLIGWIDRIKGADPFYDGAMSEQHARIMADLPFGDGLTVARLQPLLMEAGFTDFRLSSHAPIARAQRQNANLRNRLRTFVYRRFILSARRPATSRTL